jgi:hypothetical protein
MDYREMVERARQTGDVTPLVKETEILVRRMELSVKNKAQQNPEKEFGDVFLLCDFLEELLPCPQHLSFAMCSLLIGAEYAVLFEDEAGRKKAEKLLFENIDRIGNKGEKIALLAKAACAGFREKAAPLLLLQMKTSNTILGKTLAARLAVLSERRLSPEVCRHFLACAREAGVGKRQNALLRLAEGYAPFLSGLRRQVKKELKAAGQSPSPELASPVRTSLLGQSGQCWWKRGKNPSL